VELQADRAGFNLLDECFGPSGVPLAEKSEVEREAFGGLEHAMDVPLSGVHVVARVPSAGPVPPPIIVVTPL
jgi:hypothetical protein